MKKSNLKSIIVGCSLLLYSSCPFIFTENPLPTPTPKQRLFVDISFEVRGTGGIQKANITYGRIDDNGMLIEGQYVNEQNAALPYSVTRTTCTGHKERLGVSACNMQEGGTLSLAIKDEGKEVAKKTLEGNCFFHRLEYYIPK